MKKVRLNQRSLAQLLSMLLFAFVIIGLMSCGDDEEGVSVNEVDEQSVEILEDDQDAQDYEGQIESDLALLDLAAVNPGGRVFEEDTIPSDTAHSCATITHDRELKTITIEYDGDCVGFDGNVRKGTILITYTDHYLIPDAVVTKTWIDFTINDNQVEGTRTVTNISVDLAAPPKFSVVLAGGIITFTDGTTIERDTDFEVEWIRAANPLNDELFKEGSANGKSRRDVVYTMTITETIVRKKICTLDGVHIPVQGEKFIEREGLPNFTIDYGQGECDNEVTIIREDGVTRTVNNFQRFRNRHRG